MVCCQVKLPLNFMILMASQFDLTADVCRERDIAIDEAGFEREMEAITLTRTICKPIRHGLQQCYSCRRRNKI